MSDEETRDGFMTHQEMADHFPGRKGLELVTLVEHDGTRMWKREPDGWYRLGSEVRGG